MRGLLLALLLTGCGVSTDVGGFFCGWEYQKLKTLDPLPPGQCWQLSPPDYMSIMPEGSASCDADEGSSTRVWCPGERVALLTKPFSSGHVVVESVPVACPTPCE